jgi:hypothetical protein
MDLEASRRFYRLCGNCGGRCAELPYGDRHPGETTSRRNGSAVIPEALRPYTWGLKQLTARK